MKNTANDDFLVGSSVDDLSTRKNTGSFSENPTAWFFSNLKQLGWLLIIIVSLFGGISYYRELQEAKNGEQVYRLSQILNQLSKVNSQTEIKPEELIGIKDSIKIFRSEAASGNNNVANDFVNLIEARIAILKNDQIEAIKILEPISQIETAAPNLTHELAALMLARIYLDQAPEYLNKGKEILNLIINNGEFTIVDAVKALDLITTDAIEKDKLKASITQLITRRPDTRKDIGSFMPEFNDQVSIINESTSNELINNEASGNEPATNVPPTVE